MPIYVIFVALIAATFASAYVACEENDAACHSLEAMQLTNEVRVRHGKGVQLRAGPKAMLNNALDHSTFMAQTGNFEHQNLGEAARKVQCNVFIS
jgi:hypothetical protein